MNTREVRQGEAEMNVSEQTALADLLLLELAAIGGGSGDVLVI